MHCDYWLTHLEQLQSLSSKTRIFIRFHPVEDAVDAAVRYNQTRSSTHRTDTTVLFSMIRLFTSKKDGTNFLNFSRTSSCVLSLQTS